MGDDGDVVCGGHAASPSQRESQACSTRSTYDATLMSSVSPPSHMTSGWMMAIARFCDEASHNVRSIVLLQCVVLTSMSLRKPYR